MLTLEQVSRIPLRLTIPHYLMASYCYYVADRSPMTDDAFDHLCKRMLLNYDRLEHEHKHLVDRGSLEAGTCMLSTVEYPLRVQLGFDRYAASCLDGTLVRLLNLDEPAPARRMVRRPAPAATAPEEKPATAPAVRRGIRRPSPVQEEVETPARPAVRRVVSRRTQ